MAALPAVEASVHVQESLQQMAWDDGVSVPCVHAERANNHPFDPLINLGSPWDRPRMSGSLSRNHPAIS